MTVVPIKTMSQLPEHGRIRTGIKSGRAMKALDTFRFTSIDKAALQQLADLYGGEVKPWSDPSANPPDQFEVITEASEIEVAVQPGTASANYELWTKGGRQRSCDGQTCSVTVSNRDDLSYEEEPCICHAQGVLECKPKTRVNVIFTGISFAGTWRYESAGLNALHTLPSMLQLIEMLQSKSGLLPVTMALVPQVKKKGGQTRKYIIVQFRPNVTVDQMMVGSGTYQAEVGTGTTELAPALEPSSTTTSPEPPPTSTTESPSGSHSSTPKSPTKRSSKRPAPSAESSETSSKESPATSDPDDDIVDAELVEEDVGFPQHGLDRATAMALARDHGRVVKKDGKKWTVE